MQRVLVWLETEASTYCYQPDPQGATKPSKNAKTPCVRKSCSNPPPVQHSQPWKRKRPSASPKNAWKKLKKSSKSVKRYTPRLQKEISIYKGGVQRLSTSISSDIPVAISRLDRMCAALDAYAALTTTGGGADDSGQLFQQMARAMGEEVARGPDFRPLRQRTGAVDRKAAAPGDVRLVEWSDGMITDEERSLFSKIATDRKPPKPEDKLIIEDKAWESSRIYLERVTGEEGDSGWFIGRADDAPAGPNLSSTVADLLQSRQDLLD